MNVADSESNGRRSGREGRPDPGGQGQPLTVGSLFAGIGGFDLGLERAGMRTVWFCEQDPFCQRVLAKHWPDVPCYPDVRELREPERVDVLCGGFPCQDLSYAGKGAGLDGERSGLWSEYARLIRELRPRYVIVENVSALLARGLGRVLGDLAACGYDAEWDCIPASAVGAPHRRDRVWLIAYLRGEQHEGSGYANGREATTGFFEADTSICVYCGQFTYDGTDEHAACVERSLCEAVCGDVGDTESSRGNERPGLCQEKPGGFGRGRSDYAGWWSTEPDVGRVAHGIPMRVDRLRSLGNALVPQIAEWIGYRIIEWEGAR